MLSELKPYPEYKDSGHKWLGKVPEKWSVLPNRAIFTEVKERNHPDEEMLSVTITRGVIRQADLLADSSKKDGSNENRSAYKLVCTDDIAYNKMRAWQGAIGVSEFRGIISPAYVVMRFRGNHNSRYYHELFRTPYFAKESERWSYGITSDMWSLRPEHYKMIYSLVPSRGEQDAIVRFLGYANGRIERAIRAKRKITGLLNEQKQVIIHRAVTRGLDAGVDLKPSGIPWLAEIPKSWEARPLKQLLVRMDYGTSENARGHGKVRVLGMGHIRDGKILIPEIGSLDHVPTGLSLEKHDLLFNRTNSPELVGKVGLFDGDVTDEITFASYLVRLRVRPEHSPHWLNYLLNSSSFWSYARSQALVSLHQANLNSSRYARMVLPVPIARKEQESIVGAIRSQAGTIERAVARVEREIELLREYRTRLVADVVTGQVDVRGVSIADMAETELEKGQSVEKNEAVEVEPAEEITAENNEN